MVGQKGKKQLSISFKPDLFSLLDGLVLSKILSYTKASDLYNFRLIGSRFNTFLTSIHMNPQWYQLDRSYAYNIRYFPHKYNVTGPYFPVLLEESIRVCTQRFQYSTKQYAANLAKQIKQLDRIGNELTSNYNHYSNIVKSSTLDQAVIDKELKWLKSLKKLKKYGIEETDATYKNIAPKKLSGYQLFVKRWVPPSGADSRHRLTMAAQAWRGTPKAERETWNDTANSEYNNMTADEEDTEEEKEIVYDKKDIRGLIDSEFIQQFFTF